MEARYKRNIKPGDEYDHLFPTALQGTDTVLRDAGVSDTVQFIPKVVAKTLDHTAKIAARLKGRTTWDTCCNIWYFVYGHIAYRKDRDGYEQIRSPARTWADRAKGVDCDCYSTFISSILTNLGVAHKLRITKYHKPYFQHIYPIVPNGKRHITMDCVTDKFNHEVPYSEKMDIDMDLQYLSGLDGPDDIRGDDIVFSGSDIGALGLFGRKKKKKNAGGGDANPMIPTDPDAIPPSGEKKKKGLKKLFGKLNKINPAAILLRNGVLAAMKLNLFKVASKLRWSFISLNTAKKLGIDEAKWRKLVGVRQKLDNIFAGAGGHPKNLRKAILKGKANKDKKVAVFGLGFLPEDDGIEYMTTSTPLPQLLGHDIYHEENIAGMEGFSSSGLDGFGELGEPITGASIAAATAVIGAIAKLLKGVGNIFGKGGGQESQDFSESAGSGAETADDATLPAASGGSPTASTAAAAAVANEDGTGMEVTTTQSRLSTTGAANTATALTTGSSSDPPATEGGFWQQNKKWLLPAVIGVGAIGIIAVGMKMMKSSPNHSPGEALNGPPKRKKKNNYGKTAKFPKRGKKKSVALL